jgi:hypothetical protein
MSATNELGDLSAFSPVLQQWLRAQAERANRDPDWIPDTVPLPEGSSVDDMLKTSSWLLTRFGVRIHRRREAERLYDIPEFVL